MQEKQIRSGIVTAARTQLGVKYRKDTHLPNVALDCVGLLAFAIKEGAGVQINTKNIQQGDIVSFTDLRLVHYLEQMGCIKVPVVEALPADFAVWTYGPAIIHTGLITEWLYPHAPEVIHSCAAYEKVVEHTLQGEWAEGRRLYGVFSIKNAISLASSNHSAG
jgi:hypothetical protein